MQCVCFVSNAQQGKWHHPVEWHTILGPHMCSLLLKQTVSGLFSSETQTEIVLMRSRPQHYIVALAHIKLSDASCKK